MATVGAKSLPRQVNHQAQRRQREDAGSNRDKGLYARFHICCRFRQLLYWLIPARWQPCNLIPGATPGEFPVVSRVEAILRLRQGQA